MKNSKLMTAFLATACLALLPNLAAADHRSRTVQTKLGEVGTHAADVEDFVPVSPPRRYDSIVLVALDGAVPLEGLKIQYADGRIVQPMGKHLVLRPGQRVTIDVPDDQPIKMLVIDYDERRSARLGDRATARVEVIGQAVAHLRYQGQRYDRVPLVHVVPRDQIRFSWHGGAYVRIN